jgi:Ca2+-binding RTX toxin-like protein
MRRIVAMLSAMTVMVVLAAGVAFAADIDCLIDACVGTKGDDQIRGTENPETIRALAGDDFVFSRGGDDTIYLDNGKDRAYGAGGNDTIYGGAGNDGFGTIPLVGAEDSDTIYGGKGNDVINAAASDQPLESPDSPVDDSYGESGNDTIDAEDGNVDYIDCGEGRKDTVYYDVGIDTVTNCEALNPPRTTPSV